MLITASVQEIMFTLQSLPQRCVDTGGGRETRPESEESEETRDTRVRFVITLT